MVLTEKPVLRQREVMAVTGMSRSTINRLRKLGEFPEPSHNLGLRILAWRTSDVLTWLESRTLVS